MSGNTITGAPRVTIIIPVFNGANFLATAIDSALAQTYGNTEILVVNDGSTDGGATERLALSYGNRVRYYSKANGGVASALNLGIRQMSGEFFSWLSHDDVYVEDKIERQVDFLLKLPLEERAKTVVYSDYCVFTRDPARAVPVLMPGVAPQDFRYWLTIENTLHGCTLLIPRRAFDEVGVFNERLRTTQDYDLWFRMAQKYQFRHLAFHLVKARSHPEQGTVRLSITARAECNSLLAGFIRDIQPEELLRSSGHEPIVAYATVAGRMYYRGFMKAGWAATKLAIGGLRGSSTSSLVRAARAAVGGLIGHYAIMPLSRAIPADLRAALRNRLACSAGGLPRSPESVRHLGLKERFSKIYSENLFRGSASRSGAGSDLLQTEVIRRELPILVGELGVRTFLDAPCGDWFWMRRVVLPVDRYIGVDIVEALIQKNRAEYGSSRVSFQCTDLARDALPRADLIFSRDCLVHLSFADAWKVLASFKRSGARYLLTTTFTSLAKNEELGDRFWRPLNMQLAPFHFPAPIRLIKENCTEHGGKYADKSLGLWLLEHVRLED